MNLSSHHTDRRLAVSDHAVDRVRERAGAGFLGSEELRNLIARECLAALDQGKAEAHYYPRQQRVLVQVLGCEVYAIIAPDTTGWGRGDKRLAVATILTPEQVANHERKPA